MPCVDTSTQHGIGCCRFWGGQLPSGRQYEVHQVEVPLAAQTGSDNMLEQLLPVLSMTLAAAGVEGKLHLEGTVKSTKWKLGWLPNLALPNLALPNLALLHVGSISFCWVLCSERHWLTQKAV